ncbi:cupin domain-containing protein [Kribbella solani]|uniref:cupin domain-containing protein n=1 Tax=Kribbella solani TaxID=236067 RepID=UPI0029A3AC90|nr:cupin domain-containing protein [Kribbella solani]MDX2970298.1 cupin domain-containing protein [Kribbella solani]MDX3000037.1 cupin domain-containing protein [Kribbella solani]
MKAEHEFFTTGDLDWVDAGGGIAEKVLSADAGDGTLTRLAHWAPGTASGAEVITHEYVEEVYLLEGELTDLTLERTFRPGDYACRPPGMPHGPYRTTAGCTMLETRYSAS